MNTGVFFNYPTEEPVSIAEQTVFLANRGQRDWRKLLGHTQTYRFSRGEVVIRQGETTRAFYIVAFGEFEVVMPELGRRHERLAVIEAGSVVGEQTFLDGKGHPTEVRTLSEGEVIRLSYDAFEILAAREPELARAILLDLGRIVSIRLRQMMSDRG